MIDWRGLVYEGPRRRRRYPQPRSAGWQARARVQRYDRLQMQQNVSNFNQPVQLSSDRLTMRMSYENLGYPAHFNAALLDLMLSSLAAIEEPDISIKSKGEGGMIPCARWLG